MEIKQRTIIDYRKRLLDYMKNEKPFRKGFETKTYILDMLYFMGLSIDEKRFYAAQGFYLFKKSIIELIDDSSVNLKRENERLLAEVAKLKKENKELNDACNSIEWP